MGKSTITYISFGYNIEKIKNVPWVYDCDVDESTYEFENKDYEDWWRSLNLHPMPFKLNDFGSETHPVYILAVPDAGLWTVSGEPEKFNPEDLKVDEEKLKLFKAFVKEYFPKLMSQKPSWWLSCDYG